MRARRPVRRRGPNEHESLDGEPNRFLALHGATPLAQCKSTHWRCQLAPDGSTLSSHSRRNSQRIWRKFQTYVNRWFHKTRFDSRRTTKITIKPTNKLTKKNIKKTLNTIKVLMIWDFFSQLKHFFNCVLTFFYVCVPLNHLSSEKC